MFSNSKLIRAQTSGIRSIH